MLYEKSSDLLKDMIRGNQFEYSFASIEDLEEYMTLDEFDAFDLSYPDLVMLLEIWGKDGVGYALYQMDLLTEDPTNRGDASDDVEPLRDDLEEKLEDFDDVFDFTGELYDAIKHVCLHWLDKGATISDLPGSFDFILQQLEDDPELNEEGFFNDSDLSDVDKEDK